MGGNNQIDQMEKEIWTFVLIIIVVLYFVPAFIARNKRNSSAIFWLNFLLGWTFLGWVGALIWAMTLDPEPPSNKLPTAEEARERYRRRKLS